MRGLIVVLLGVAVVAAAVLWFLTAPTHRQFASPGEPDLARGEEVFWAGGCTSCHAAPGAKGDDKLVLAGGLAIKSDFGTFFAPNISSNDAVGIGGWTLQQFVDAMTQGTSPEGTHLYPSFPYTSYTRMTISDLNDLFGYMLTLPSSDNVAPAHELGFPFDIRRAVGLWNLLYLVDKPVISIDPDSTQLLRGQYLVEGPGHCGECHTPRNILGALEDDHDLAGTLKGPDGKKVPNVTPHPKDGIGEWSDSDITFFLQLGVLPDGDVAGGAMEDVIREGTGHLTDEDRKAIAAYLKSLPEHAGP